MTGLAIEEFSEYSGFAREWEPDGEGTTKLIWQLLGELNDDELLIKLPEWLAEEKVGYTNGSIPTEFVGRIEEETEKAIRFTDATAARPLGRLAHRMAALEDGIESAGDDDDRSEWLTNRLEDKRDEFETREGMVCLREEWLPKSQIVVAVRRTG